MSNNTEKIIGGLVIGLVVAAGIDLLLKTFSKNDKLISREGTMLLSNPDDKKKLYAAIKKSREGKESEFTKSNGEKITIIG